MFSWKKKVYRELLQFQLTLFKGQLCVWWCACVRWCVWYVCDGVCGGGCDVSLDMCADVVHVVYVCRCAVV